MIRRIGRFIRGFGLYWGKSIGVIRLLFLFIFGPQPFLIVFCVCLQSVQVSKYVKSSSCAEEYCVKALSQGDVKAFDSLFASYFPKIKRFLSGFLDSPEEAEDLAQDVFVKLWQHRSSLIYVDNLNAYLYRIAKNTLYNYLEKNRYAEFSASIPEIPTMEMLEEILFAKELEEIIELAIEKMPPQRKTIFTLSRKEGISNEEIANRLQISKRTVETHISAALSDIRKAIRLLLLFF